MNLVSKLKQIVKPAARPRFSLCHATARMPDGWVEAMEAWTSRADHPEQCEYVLCVDKANVAAFRAFTPEKIIEGPLVQSRLVVNEGRQCAVDGWNSACAAATGEVIITVADDWFPPEHWDTLLWDLLMKNGGNVDYLPHYTQRAVWVATGVNDKLMTFSILTRAYYQRYGYVFYPEYIGMYADNDFQKQCERDGALIDARQLLPVFEHRHPAAGTAEVDDIYRRQNRAEAYHVGRELFGSRWGGSHFSTVHDHTQAVDCAAGCPAFVDAEFVHTLEELVMAPGNVMHKKRIAVCLPGESFSKHFLKAWGEILAFLLMKRNFIVTPLYGHCSNVYVMRQCMANTIDALPDVHEFVLWIDDDQVVTAQNVEHLLETLEKYHGIDMVAGWTYIQDETTGVTKISAGKYSADGSTVACIPIPEMLRIATAGDPVEVEWTGFPVVLMRHSTIKKATENARERNGIPNPFAPIPAPNSPAGFTGEDISFCINVKDRDGRIYVDSRVFVEHLKLRPIRPPQQDKPKEEAGNADAFFACRCADPERRNGVGGAFHRTPIDCVYPGHGMPLEEKRLEYTGV